MSRYHRRSDGVSDEESPPANSTNRGQVRYQGEFLPKSRSDEPSVETHTQLIHSDRITAGIPAAHTPLTVVKTTHGLSYRRGNFRSRHI